MAETKQYREVGNKIYIYPDTGLERMWMNGQIVFPENKEMYFNVTAYDTVLAAYPDNAAHIHVYSYYLLCVQKQEYMPGIDPELAWSAESATATIGETNTFPTLTNEYDLTVTYSSSSEAVATISSTGEITLVAAGTTTIKAAFAGSATYEADEATYTLTVESQEPVSPELAWSAESATAEIGGTNTYPTLTNPYSVNVEYTSSDESAATINAETGEITLVAVGTTTISAVFEGNETYSAETVTYTLTVTQAVPLLSPELGWNYVDNGTWTNGTLDGNPTYPILINPHNVSDIVWTSDNQTKIRVARTTGVITLRNVDEWEENQQATITATFEGDGTYEAQTISYTLIVELGVATEPSPQLCWNATSASAVYGEQNTFPTLSNPNSTSVRYWASDFSYQPTSVASIDQSTGVITLTGNGSCYIAAEHDDDGTYRHETTLYTLTVSGAPAPQKQIHIVEDNYMVNHDIYNGTTGNQIQMWGTINADDGDEIYVVEDNEGSSFAGDAYLIDQTNNTVTQLTTAQDTKEISGETKYVVKTNLPQDYANNGILVFVQSGVQVYEITKNFEGKIYIDGAHGFDISWYYDYEDPNTPGTYVVYMPGNCDFGVESRGGEQYTFNPTVTFVSGGSVGTYVDGGISADTEITKTN